LREAACFAGHEENFETARIAGNFVTAQRSGKILRCLKAGGEDDGVFDGEAGALAEVGADGMSGVAKDGDATNDPRKSGEAILNFCVDGAFGTGDEFGNGGVPAGKEFVEGVALGEIAGEKGIICGGIPVDAPRAETENAEATTVAVGFGEIAVVFEAELASVEIGM